LEKCEFLSENRIPRDERAPDGIRMSVDAVGAGGSFYVGDVVARAWNVFIGNLPFFLGITLLTYLAIGITVGLLVLPFVLVGAGGDAWWWLIFIGVLVGFLVFFSLNTIGEAVLLLGAFQRMRGQPLRVNEALQRGFARFFPLIGLGILWALGFLVGFLLLIIPGVILLCMWWVAVPACDPSAVRMHSHDGSAAEADSSLANASDCGSKDTILPR